jgi:Family of unknown function (DUF6502)
LTGQHRPGGESTEVEDPRGGVEAAHMESDRPGASLQRQQALRDAVRALLEPLARLAVTEGLPFSAVEEAMKQAFVQAASNAHPGLLAHRRVSRVSTVTGINRREVTRLLLEALPARPRGRSLPAEVYAHWLGTRRYQGAHGEPLVLPRQGPAPSFESLAQEITRDVHPRSLLDEMLRLRLATLDAGTDTVQAAAGAAPVGDAAPMLGFLGDNVGDHLRAAVDNVVGEGRPHFEQALFADGVSETTIDWARQVAREQWRALRLSVVGELERRIAADAKLAGPRVGRLRMGLYTFGELAAAPQAPPGMSRKQKR